MPSNARGYILRAGVANQTRLIITVLRCRLSYKSIIGLSSRADEIMLGKPRHRHLRHDAALSLSRHGE